MSKIFSNEIFRIAVGLALFIPGAVLEHLGYTAVAVILLISSLAVSGFSIFYGAVKGILRADFLDEKFLMSIASIGAMIIGEYTEGPAVMLFFLIGQYFEHKAVRRSRNSIRSLLDICPDTARVLIDGIDVMMDAEDVEEGSVILVRPGERMPIDSRIISGECKIDTSSLTGESMPSYGTVGDEIYSGSVVLDGVVTCVTIRSHSESHATRILELVENAKEAKSKQENFISVFAKIYTPIVTVLALMMAIIPTIIGVISWQSATYRALSFLVVSCPCALVISVPMAFFGGIGAAAAKGILYKGGNTFAPVASVESVVFDKTGTLTTGEFTIAKIDSEIEEGELLKLIASAEYNSNHPIARCLKSQCPGVIAADDIKDIAGKGIMATVGTDEIAVGNAALMSDIGVTISDDSYSVYVARNGEYIGAVLVKDTIKQEAKKAIERLRAMGVRHTHILSGDRKDSVDTVARELGIDTACHGLLPEDKYRALEEIISNSRGGVVYIGDGINDAPCLMRADVGIAMGKMGSDSAIESADAVIISDNLERIPDTVNIARKTLRISKQNIFFAITVKLLAIILAAFNLAGMWMAVFADVGVAVIAILNSMRALKSK